MNDDIADIDDETEENEEEDTLLPEMPAGIHADIATARDKRTGQDRTALIVWSDDTTDRCDRCHDEIGREADCPIIFDPTDPVDGFQEKPLQHGCGEIITVNWEVVQEPTADEAVEAVRKVHQYFLDQQEGQRKIWRKKLSTELRKAIADPSTVWPVQEEPDLGCPPDNAAPDSHLYRGKHDGLRRAAAIDLADPDLGDEIIVTEEDL